MWPILVRMALERTGVCMASAHLCSWRAGVLRYLLAAVGRDLDPEAMSAVAGSASGPGALTVGDHGLDALEAFQQLMDVVVLPDGEGAAGLQHHHLSVLEVAANPGGGSPPSAPPW